MASRVLTADEIDIFLARYGDQIDAFWWWDEYSIPDQGKYIYSPELGGQVLVFEKANGEVMFVLTEFVDDPSAADPEKLDYILSETWNEVKRRTLGLATGVQEYAEGKLNYVLIGVGIIGALLLLNTIKK